MKLTQATTESDWSIASSILIEVMNHLNANSNSLWVESQLNIDGLKAHYTLADLHLFHGGNDIEGVVFLQERDPLFWPELGDTHDSVFIHKLAIKPKYRGKEIGSDLLRLIELHAKNNGKNWLRLDCDDRKPLHQFYLANGFRYVDIGLVNQCRVARYEKDMCQES